jgi:hypothetical protein
MGKPKGHNFLIRRGFAVRARHGKVAEKAGLSSLAGRGSQK